MGAVAPTYKIKSMDNSLYASELLDTLRVDSWDKFFTRPDIVDYLRDYGIRETFTFFRPNSKRFGVYN